MRFRSLRTTLAATSRPAAAALACCAAMTGCGSPPHVRVTAFRNLPQGTAQVTDGTFTASGGVSVHVADRAGPCGTLTLQGAAGADTVFVSALTSDDGDSVTAVFVELPSFHGAGVYTGEQGAVAGLVVGAQDVATVPGSLGIRVTSGRSFASMSDVTVTMTTASSGSVHAVATERHDLAASPPPAATGAAPASPGPESAAPTPVAAASSPAAGAAPASVGIDGSFSCVDAGT